MAVAAYTLRLSPPPRQGSPLLPRLRPHLRRRAAAKVAASWAPAAGDSDDGFGGWGLPEPPPLERERRTGIGRAIAVGLGASVAIGLAGLAWYSPSSRKCLQQLINSSLHYVQEKTSTLESQETPEEDASERESDETEASSTALDEKAEAITDESRQNHTGGTHVLFSVPVDPVHEEAFSILKKLQIIENDVSSNDFCTRREFARWFVKLCSKYERKRMQRIIPDKLTAGSGQTAFDDVNIDDPDFLYIQSLGESGIVPSKLSNSFGTSTSGSSSCCGNSKFLPDSYLSRFDLVNWKVLLEHPCALEIDQKMLSRNVRILDLSTCPNVSVSLLMELMAGENSIVSKVFGNTRRLQPQKPVTKAQAAAALTSGRMEEAIRDELNRLEVENHAHLSAIAEITEELTNKGDIPKYWEEKIKNEQERVLEADKDLQDALHELTNEKTHREKELADLSKERAALEHQNQELVSLRSEIDGMYDRLATESEEVLADQQTLENLLSDVSSKHQAVSETKSQLGAEKEALTMLRSWVEEEAARVHQRAETLEKALRRWRIPVD
ncbi:hypothetical protein EJB05_44946 [Eragrostis curvula]|uniref:SLH domain-containing protein n=1 Tax=Eragrostis curvula TaxID=38414 RepID=A0A5J9TIY0_9POAL|nr:hypothetical protein EJB05_44946 [Eragrostis curvula]